MKKLATTTMLVLVSGLIACQDARLQTRTFELQHLQAGEAERIIAPYVFTDRESTPGRISAFSDGITVRETTDNLDKIERVLESLDRPRPSVQLRFQIVRANGDGNDPRIEHLESLLRDLFRYEGYRLVDEARLMSAEGGHSRQRVALDGRPGRIVAEVSEIRTGEGSEGSGSVRVLVALEEGEVAGPGTDVISTTVTLRLGQTAVLGSSRTGADGEAIILTVRPELADTSTSRASS